ncbi:MAG: hypothetical protein K0R91_799 [Nitrososphaeraceae archaeon]|jgi:hypothetical protein|nr:hypothetical protein [Nitrososphaeraceae archaeon]
MDDETGSLKCNHCIVIHWYSKFAIRIKSKNTRERVAVAYSYDTCPKKASKQLMIKNQRAQQQRKVVGLFNSIIIITGRQYTKWFCGILQPYDVSL